MFITLLLQYHVLHMAQECKKRLERIYLKHFNVENNPTILIYHLKSLMEEGALEAHIDDPMTTADKHEQL